jgi:hypothetical protein
MSIRDPYFDASEDIPAEAEPRKADVDTAPDPRDLPGAPGPKRATRPKEPKVGGQQDMARRHAQVKDYMDRLTAGHTLTKEGGASPGDVGMATEQKTMGWQPTRMRSKLMSDWDAPLPL